MSDDKEIVIDLTRSRDAQADAEDKYFIHRESRGRLRRILTQIMDKNKELLDSDQKDERQHSFDARIDYPRVHDAILISGGRGTGKSTFILSIFEQIRANTFFKDEKRKVCPLAIIDPTLIEDRENILIFIISRIKELVEERYEKKQGSPFREWQDSLRDLARGLRLLKGVGSSPLEQEAWDDPQFILAEGLDNALHNSKLERNLNKFLKKSLDLLKKDFFLFAFDDIDTSFDRGWPVLEVLRKYLTSPHLLILISGDLRLYAELIRKRQWENFGDLATKFEAEERTRRFHKSALHLEEQYLLKILKTEYRIHLRLLDWYRDNDYTIKIACADEREGDLDKVFQKLCQDVWFTGNEREVSAYTRRLLALPARALFQILRAYVNETDQSWSFTDGGQDRFLTGLAHVFSTVLARYHVDMDDVTHIDRAFAFNRLATLLIEEDLFQDCWRLKPEFVDSELNQLMICLSGYYGLYMERNPAGILNYGLKNGLVHEVFRHDPYGVENQSEKENLQRIARYLLLDSDSSAQAISNRMTAYLYQPKRLVSCGTVRIYSEAVRDWRSLRFLKANYGVEQISDLPHIARENSWEEVESYEAFFTNNLFPYYQEVAKLLGPDKRRAFWGRYLNTLQTLTDGMNDDWHVHFIHLPFIHAADKHGSRPMASIHNIIAWITSLMEQEPDRVESTFRSIAIANSTEVKSYSVYFSGGEDLLEPEAQEQTRKSRNRNTNKESEASSKEDPNDENIVAEDSGEVPAPIRIDPKFIKAMVAWRKQTEEVEEFKISPYLAAKIWIRFHRILKAIDDQPDTHKNLLYVGRTLHQFSIAFLNAVLVESLLYFEYTKYNGKDIEIDLAVKNPVTSDDLFLNNLRLFLETSGWEQGDRLVHKDTALSFFRFLFTCPIWGFYLDPKSKTYERYKSELVKIVDEDLTESDIASFHKTRFHIWKIQKESQPTDPIHIFYLLNSLTVDRSKADSPSSKLKRGRKSKQDPEETEPLSDKGQSADSGGKSPESDPGTEGTEPRPGTDQPAKAETGVETETDESDNL